MTPEEYWMNILCDVEDSLVIVNNNNCEGYDSRAVIESGPDHTGTIFDSYTAIFHAMDPPEVMPSFDYRTAYCAEPDYTMNKVHMINDLCATKEGEKENNASTDNAQEESEDLSEMIGPTTNVESGKDIFITTSEFMMNSIYSSKISVVRGVNYVLSPITLSAGNTGFAIRDCVSESLLFIVDRVRLLGEKYIVHTLYADDPETSR